MMPTIIALILSAAALLILLAQPSRVIYIKLLSVPVLCIIFILCLILLSEPAVKAAIKGLSLWAEVVVPSLFPFFAAAEMIKSTGFMRAAGILLEPVMRPFFRVPGCGSFPLLMGVTSGYPVGAKITCDFRKSGDLTKSEAERLLAYTNNSGPLFIIGAVGTGMLGSHSMGIYLYICHVMACVTVGFIFRFYKTGGKNETARKITEIRSKGNLPRSFRKRLIDDYSKTVYHFGTILGDAIKNSVSTILAIGGFIVLFSVIINFLKESGLISGLSQVISRALPFLKPDKAIIEGLLCGLFEITTGSDFISNCTGVSAIHKLPVLSFIIGWAGLSVHCQVISITAQTDVSIRPYILGKFLQGVISSIYTWLGLKLLRPDILPLEPVLGNGVPVLRSWLYTFGTASMLAAAVLLLFITAAIRRPGTALRK